VVGVRRSKLELYVAVLNAVAVRGPLNITGLLLRARLNHVQLKPILTNLISKGAVQELHLRGSSIVYAATPLGQRLSNQLKPTGESKTALPDEAKQNLVAMLI
jgi:predicted transcriptional regulator